MRLHQPTEPVLRRPALALASLVPWVALVALLLHGAVAGVPPVEAARLLPADDSFAAFEALPSRVTAPVLRTDQAGPPSWLLSWGPEDPRTQAFLERQAAEEAVKQRERLRMLSRFDANSYPDAPGVTFPLSDPALPRYNPTRDRRALERFCARFCRPGRDPSAFATEVLALVQPGRLPDMDRVLELR